MSLQELLPGNVPQTPKNPTVENQGNRRTQNITILAKMLCRTISLNPGFLGQKPGFSGFEYRNVKFRGNRIGKKKFSEHFVPECTYILT